MATQLRTEIGKRVTQDLSTYLETPHLINRMSADAVRLGKLDLQDLSAVERHLYFQLSQFDFKFSIHFANLHRDVRSVANTSQLFSTTEKIFYLINQTMLRNVNTVETLTNDAT